jgi:hypothetical protein
MDKQVITISEDVMNTVIKPISLFLNDIAKGTIFTHNAMNTKGVSAYDIVDDKLPVFFYTSNKGGTYKFTSYDLRNFSCKGVAFKDSFQVERGKVIHVAETFTLSKASTALLIEGEKVYPPFCYKNFTEYAAQKALQPIGTYPTAEMLAFLKEDGVKDSDVDKYYRTVDTDKPLFFYKANGK